MKRIPWGDLWLLSYVILSGVFLYLGWLLLEAFVILLGLGWAVLAIIQGVSIVWYPKRRYHASSFGAPFVVLAAAHFYSAVTRGKTSDFMIGCGCALLAILLCWREAWRAQHPDEIEDP